MDNMNEDFDSLYDEDDDDGVVVDNDTPDGIVNNEDTLESDTDPNNLDSDSTEDLVPDTNDSDFYEEGNEADLEDLEGNASGIELALSKFGVEGGKIQFEDGTTSQFEDLTPNQQSFVLETLMESQVSKKYGELQSQLELTEEEAQFLNRRRENNVPIAQLIEEEATKLANIMSAKSESNATDYVNMADEGIYLTYLLDKFPEATDEVLLDKVDKMKSLDQFQDIVAPLRDKYISDQIREQEAVRRESEMKEAQELDSQREEIVNSSLGINSIMGMEIDDDSRNEVLGDLLELNEYGDSKFFSDVFSDPETLFKVAWLHKYGDTIANSKDDYWKKKVTEAYKSGRTDAIKGMPSKSINFKGKNKTKQTKTKKHVNVSNEGIDSLYDE